MSTPQDPNHPQDPADPANPYGTQPPPPPATPPYGQPDYGQAPPPPPPQQQPPAYGQPAPPAYGQPPAPPAYGQQPYGQPGYTAPYGQPGFPGGPEGQQPASKGMAITSLVLGILGCAGITALISIVLGIVVLLRGKDGRNHGKGMAIAGIVLSVLWILGLGAVTIAGLVVGSSYASIDDLDSGTCITAKGLSDSGDSVTEIKKVSCSSAHDGEVLATHDLTGSEADSYGNDEAKTLCQTAVTAAGKLDLVAGKINVIGLTESSSPNSGDKLACVAFNSDGSTLSSALG